MVHLRKDATIKYLTTIVSRQSPAELDRYLRGLTGHVARPGRSILLALLSLSLAIPHLAHAKTELTADESIPIPKVEIDAKGNLQITASSTSSASDFDFLVGKWKMHNRHLNKRLENLDSPTPSSNPLRPRGAAGGEGAEPSKWTEFDSSSVNSKILAGTGDMDIYSTTHFPGQEGKLFEGLTLRLFDPKTRLWSLYWTASNTGTLEPPQVGSFENGCRIFLC